MVEPSLSTPRRLPFAILRGLSIFFGATLVAHGLAIATDGGRIRTIGNEDFTTTGISGAGLPSYLEWLADAIAVESDLIRALGNTSLLAAVGVVIGLVIGGLFSLLVKIEPLAKALGVLSSPALAIAVPGVALYPAASWAASRQWLPDPPDRLDPSDLAGPWFYLFWAVPIGLALATVLGAKLAGPIARRTFGLDVAGLAAVSRSTAVGSGFGPPTIVLLLTLAATEVMSGHNGLFGRFYVDLVNNDLQGVLGVVLVVALIGAALATAFDLIPGVTGGQDKTLPPTRRSEAAWPLVACLLVVCTIVAVGYLRDPNLGSIADGSVGPTMGGPWLGTDAAGQSLIERTVVALGPTLFGGLLPAVVAWIAGGLFAALIRRSPLSLGRAFDALIDGLRWPAPLVLPLVHLSVGNPERSEFHLGVIALTGLLLTPLATRLAARTAPASRNGVRPAIRALAFLTALGVSTRLLLGFFGLTDGPHGSVNADLGAMISANATGDPFRQWPLVIPALVSVALLSSLYWLAAAITAPVPYRRLADADRADDRTELDQAVDQPIDRTKREGPLQPQDLRTIGRPSTSGVDRLGGENEPAPSVAATDTSGESEPSAAEELAPAEAPTPNLMPDVGDPAAGAQDPETEIDLTESASEDANVTDTDSPDQPTEVALDDQGLDEETKAELEMLHSTSIDLAADASRTIRLRPSTLRRAGIVAPGAEPQEKGQGERSILASRTEDYGGETRPDAPTVGSTAPDEDPSTNPEQAED